MSCGGLGDDGANQPHRLHPEQPSAVTHRLRGHGLARPAERPSWQHVRIVAAPGRRPLEVLGHPLAGYGTGVQVFGQPGLRVGPSPFHGVQKAKPRRARLTAALRPRAVSSSCAHQQAARRARPVGCLSAGRGSRRVASALIASTCRLLRPPGYSACAAGIGLTAAYVLRTVVLLIAAGRMT